MFWHITDLITTLTLLWLCHPTQADSTIDLQWAICDDNSSTVLRKLGHAGMEPHKSNNITYYDTSPPTHTAQGLAFRTKVHKHQPISIIKARFDEEIEDVPSGVDCVWDQYGNATYFTCGLSWPLYDDVEDRWSDDQIAFAERYQDINWAGLVPYGPFVDPKWKLGIEGFEATFDDVIVETDGGVLHLMEIEVPVDIERSESAYDEITAYLIEHGVVLCGPLQLPKTMRLFHALEKSSVMIDEQQITLRERRTHSRDFRVELDLR